MLSACFRKGNAQGGGEKRHKFPVCLTIADELEV
jgi:hypothetical protein